MERISLPFFCSLGALLNSITVAQYDRRARAYLIMQAYRLDAHCRGLLESNLRLPVCRQPGIELMNSISEATISYNEAMPNWYKESKDLDNKFIDFITKARQFEIILNAELQMLDTYHVTQKGIYNTSSLIGEAENVLPVTVLKKIDKEIVGEIRESGKCLAFGCATASGFHILRATEAILHKYYIYICKPENEKKLDNWGEYISALHKTSEDSTVKEDVKEDVKKVVALLQQIKKQDRNLIMHPEVVLSPDDAFRLFEIAKGAIIAMADKLPA